MIRWLLLLALAVLLAVEALLLVRYAQAQESFKLTPGTVNPVDYISTAPGAGRSPKQDANLAAPMNGQLRPVLALILRRSRRPLSARSSTRFGGEMSRGQSVCANLRHSRSPPAASVGGSIRCNSSQWRSSKAI